jgi:hypothetical protein
MKKNLIGTGLLLLNLTYLSINHSFAETPLNTYILKGEDPNLTKRIEEAKTESLKSGPKFELVGIIEKGSRSTFSINGEDFTITSSATIIGSLKNGKKAIVSGKIISGIKYAESITISESSNVVGSEPPNFR